MCVDCAWLPSYMRLTNCHSGKNIREVLLKPLPTFGRLGHVLAILHTEQYILSGGFPQQTSYFWNNTFIINICLTICTYLSRQRAHCRETGIFIVNTNQKYISHNTKWNKKKGLYLHSIELLVDNLNLGPLTPALISLMNPSQ